MEVYPAIPGSERPISDERKAEIRRLHREGKSRDVLDLLLEVAREGDNPFAIEHPYASIFRQLPELVDLNPGVYKTLAGIIQKMSADDIIRGVERPIDLNRQMGPVFKNWAEAHFTEKGLRTYRKVDQFAGSGGKGLFLGGDPTIKKFCVERFGINPGNRDFIYRTGSLYVVGEARFLSTGGGSQGRDVKITAGFAQPAKASQKGTIFEYMGEKGEKMKERVLQIAVADGIFWFDKEYLAALQALGDDEHAMTVLLLDEFFESFG